MTKRTANRTIGTNSDPGAIKRAQIEAAWKLHEPTPIASAAGVRKGWLRGHFAAQHGFCAYCQIAMVVDTGKDRRATLDHVVPLSLGGEDAEANTVAACLHCNTSKGQMSRAAYLRNPALAERLLIAARPPDRLSIDPGSAYYNEVVVERGVDVLFNGQPRTSVVEYSSREGWIRIRTPAKDRHGRTLILKFLGHVEPQYRNAAT